MPQPPIPVCGRCAAPHAPLRAWCVARRTWRSAAAVSDPPSALSSEGRASSCRAKSHCRLPGGASSRLSTKVARPFSCVWRWCAETVRWGSAAGLLFLGFSSPKAKSGSFVPIVFVRRDTHRLGPGPTWPPSMTRPATTWGGEDGRRPPPPTPGRAAVASGRQRRVWVWPQFLQSAPLLFAARRPRRARAAAGPVLRGHGGEPAAAPRGAHPVRSRRLGVLQPRILRKSMLERPHSRDKRRVPLSQRRIMSSSSLWCFRIGSIQCIIVRQASEAICP